ncbi:MAG: FMN-binding glutamate synthase family protein [Bdellovibrionales bacterium]|nr:FMN-binding glutamate synthase family protein [Bdellovibrionales bacterium]
MRKQFYFISFGVFAIAGLVSYFLPIFLYSFFILIPVFVVGVSDTFQKRKAVLRNFPVIGHFRYMFEAIRPEIQQYFVEDDVNGTPISREFRSVVYQRAKSELDTVPFGTQRNVYDVGYEWANHSIAPRHVDPKSIRVVVGGPDCSKPYSASPFNISAMSFGALSNRAILSLNGGAKLGNFYHNTGEGGLSDYHKEPGGDVVWQIGTGYFGCRNRDGTFSSEMFKDNVAYPHVKMVEIKLSQGAKPAHGGILPAAKITPEIARIRGVELGKDVISPPFHKEFNTPIGLLKFVEKLRTLSGGLPVGFKLCVGHPHEFIAIAKAIMETSIYPDYIAVDGGEGGTGAAPLEFSNSLGTPLDEGLVFVHDVLTGFGIRDKIKIVSTGKIITAFQILNKMALGADIAASARGMMLALGCIQARRCNSNHCPVGVATQDPSLVKGLDVTDKTHRIFNYHRKTIDALAELMGAIGVESPAEINRSHINRRISRMEVKTYEDIYPSVGVRSFLSRDIPEKFKPLLSAALSDSFKKVA